MIVRIRLRIGARKKSIPPPGLDLGDESLRTPLPSHPAAAVLTRLSVLAIAFALWRLSVDLNIAPWFVVPSGIFSHWQVWLALAVALQGGAFLLNKRVRREAEESFPSILESAMQRDEPSRSRTTARGASE